jgi:GT2 family glycosyltransferase
MKKFSIVVLNWDDLDLLKLSIPLIKRYTEDFELIIVDQGSTQEGTKEFIKAEADKFIFNDHNLGVPKGWNQGAAISSGLYLVTMGADELVGKGWLTEMMKTMETHESCVCVGPLHNPANSNLQQRKGDFEQDTEIDFITTNCMLVKKEVFDRFKLDEEFGLGHYEDNYFGWQLRQAGYKCYVSVKSDVSHHHPAHAFIDHGINLSQLIHKNREIFLRKIALTSK